MSELPLTKGFVARVDDEDLARLAAFRWHANVQGVCVYGKRHVSEAGRKRSIYLHREVVAGIPGVDLSLLASCVVDHANGDTLDNRRSNLRILTARENGWNQGPRHGTSRFKGVRWHYGHQQWHAYIRVRGVQLHLGCFDSEEAAARAYDVAAVQHFNGVARLNFPSVDQVSS